jgi:crotonobetainyl-CoA:carnitine CoA-transferase CaiB-like acyl-CoA transferase
MVRSAPIVTFSATPGRVGIPCTRGEHNRALLAEIGCTAAQIDALEADGVVIPPG